MVVILLAVSSAQAESAPSHSSPPRPSLIPLIGQYLARRPGAVTAAIYDVNSNQSWSYNGGMRNDTASIVKVDILEARLHQTHGQLSSHERRLAAAMIEQSDNNAATALWNEDGGAVGDRRLQRRGWAALHQLRSARLLGVDAHLRERPAPIA